MADTVSMRFLRGVTTLQDEKIRIMGLGWRAKPAIANRSHAPHPSAHLSAQRLPDADAVTTEDVQSSHTTHNQTNPQIPSAQLSSPDIADFTVSGTSSVRGPAWWSATISGRCRGSCCLHRDLQAQLPILQRRTKIDRVLY